MERDEFIKTVFALKDFILDSIEEFLVNSDLGFDREAFLLGTSIDLRQLVVEAMVYGADRYIVEDPESARAA